jgi:fatty acyl-CoA reductase
MPESWVKGVTERILETKPNTYSYSKHMAERLVESCQKELPVCIVRPGAILAAYREPSPGWNESSSSITQYYRLIFGGAFHTVLYKQNGRFDVTPVDFAVNTVLAAAWRRGLWPESGLQVYNCTPGRRNPVIHHDIITWGCELVDMSYLSKGGYFSSPTFSTSDSVFFWKNLVFRYLPRTLQDTIRSLPEFSLGKMELMTKNQHRAKILAYAFKPFTVDEWEFDTKNMATLHQLMSQPDRETFYIDFSTINWEVFSKAFAEATWQAEAL